MNMDGDGIIFFINFHPKFEFLFVFLDACGIREMHKFTCNFCSSAVYFSYYQLNPSFVYYQMKSLIVLCLIGISLVSAIRLQVDSRVVLENSYELSCSGAQGPVTYEIKNLPAGVTLNDNVISITSQN